MTSWIFMAMFTLVLLSCDHAEGLYHNKDFKKAAICNDPRLIAPIIVKQSFPMCLICISSTWTECPIPMNFLLNMHTNTQSYQNNELTLRRLLETGNMDGDGKTKKNIINYLAKSLETTHSVRNPALPHALLKWRNNNLGNILSKSLGISLLPTTSITNPEPQLLSQVNHIGEELQTSFDNPLQIGSLPIGSYLPPIPIATTDVNKDTISINDNDEADTKINIVNVTKPPEIAHRNIMSTVTPRINSSPSTLNNYFRENKQVTTRISIETDSFISTSQSDNYFKYDYMHSTKSLLEVNSDPTRNENINKLFQILKGDHSTKITRIHREELAKQKRSLLLDTFARALEQLERKFYTTTFNKLTSISPGERRENGISFVQSGLFLSLLLMALSTETDKETGAEIDKCLALNFTETDKIEVIKSLLTMLPNSTDDLKFRRSFRLVLGASQGVSKHFECGAATALRMPLKKLTGSETDEQLARDLNLMVQLDSGGAIRDTFDPEELSSGVRAVVLTTLYFRSRWRSAPTVLNGTRAFRDADGAPARSTRMIRINDIMRYSNHHGGHFQALEISYSTPGLTLLLLIPNGRSLRPLASRLATEPLEHITRNMVTMRVAATMPLYTLRMTLLLPSKLQTLTAELMLFNDKGELYLLVMMGIHKLMSDNSTSTDSGNLKLSHAIQRVMFWAEAGRNAFKDDGIEWDEAPELELVVDRPYLFFVRWHNVTLMNGNFVL